MEGISVRFGCDPVIYPPPAPGVFPYYTERIYLFRLSTGAVAISSMIGVVNFYPTTKWYTNDTFGCFCLGTGFSFGRSVSDCIKTFKLGVDSHPHVVAHNTSEAPLWFPTLPLPVFFSAQFICYFDGIHLKLYFTKERVSNKWIESHNWKSRQFQQMKFPIQTGLNFPLQLLTWNKHISN